MSFINPYRETIILGKKPKNKSKQRKIIIAFLYLLLFFAVIFFIFFQIKSLLKIPTTQQVSYYAVFMPIEASDYSTAETLASDSKARGGAGVIYKDGENFCVILAVYPNKEYATQVISQLQVQDIDASYHELKIKTLSLNNMNDTEITIAQNIHSKYLETLLSLYTLSCDLDTDKISQSTALMRISELALLWEQRTQSIAQKIDPSATSETDNEAHILYPTYNLALYVTSQLKYLATENTYQTSLKTFISVIRQINYMLCTI